jgi:hypothetical protein
LPIWIRVAEQHHEVQEGDAAWEDQQTVESVQTQHLLLTVDDTRGDVVAEEFELEEGLHEGSVGEGVASGSLEYHEDVVGIGTYRDEGKVAHLDIDAGGRATDAGVVRFNQAGTGTSISAFRVVVVAFLSASDDSVPTDGPKTD